MYYVYVLRSCVNGDLYKGSTENLERRLIQHNEGLVKYTSKFKPWELVYYEEFETRSLAVRRERFFKTGKGRELLKLILSGKQKPPIS